MSFLDELLPLMTQSVTIEPLSTARTNYGEPQWGTAVTYRCRIAGKRTKVINAQGQEVMSQQTVYLGTATAVEPTARITLSTADAGSTFEDAIHPPILATARFPDENGACYSAVYL